MEMVAPAIFMLVAVLISAVVGQIFPKVPVSLVQIALGVLLAVTPVHLDIVLDPEFFLLFFIAPLLYWDCLLYTSQAGERAPQRACGRGDPRAL